jgi:hypothetical protein
MRPEKPRNQYNYYGHNDLRSSGGTPMERRSTKQTPRCPRSRVYSETKQTGQIRRKVKEDKIGIGIAGARSLSAEAGEGSEVAKKKGRIT